MACGPKEYRAHAESCLRRARTVHNPIFAKEFEKLAQSWLRLAKASERGGVVIERCSSVSRNSSRELSVAAKRRR
jgi:hypothetical protein